VRARVAIASGWCSAAGLLRSREYRRALGYAASRRDEREWLVAAAGQQPHLLARRPHQQRNARIPPVAERHEHRVPACRVRNCARKIRVNLMPSNTIVAPVLARPHPDQIRILPLFFFIRKLAAPPRLPVVALAIAGAAGRHAHLGNEQNVWFLGLEEG